MSWTKFKYLKLVSSCLSGELLKISVFNNFIFIFKGQLKNSKIFNLINFKDIRPNISKVKVRSNIVYIFLISCEFKEEKKMFFRNYSLSPSSINFFSFSKKSWNSLALYIQKCLNQFFEIINIHIRINKIERISISEIRTISIYLTRLLNFIVA